ncbi:DUF305 domain-containing protein [Quadrisphaera sp. INWT6]|uniref:DUF305 domain-containing protein n=1 Tax=Quadrisphaera sp. INWT6 TaxID=2596917 RepID=UPI0018921B37|nr:DUF305 domain-containing protein [Quadrisphaera sp. INWT6]MBF5082680.1 DUF305 domain-containing protein [Quadrisphaera sp. INWT6]
MSPDTSSPTSPQTSSPTGPAGRDPLVTALAAFAAVALAAAVVMCVLYVRSATSSSAASSSPSDTSVEAGFARDMQAHHRQAVTMSLLVLERTDDASVRTLASDIMLTQQAQAGQMAGWLDLWGLPQTGSQPVMAWMEHDDAGTRSGHDGHSAGDTAGTEGMDDDGASDVVTGVAAMPGMASAEDLARLQAASGTDAERLYLQLMIPHHEAGVEMAEAALTETDDPTVDRLAASIEASQTSELAVLRTLLAERQG